jgi:mono/diheme cytochrome c family protein
VKSVAIPIASLVWTLALSPARLLPAQETGRKNPDFVITSLVGRDLFDFYCASCHGRDGKGAGRVAPALKVRPTDLTTLAQRNKGTFPGARVEAVLLGKEKLSTPAHGSSDMPVWGPIFRGLDSREEVNAARIENLVKYIESIQAKAKAEGTGAGSTSRVALFR